MNGQDELKEKNARVAAAELAGLPAELAARLQGNTTAELEADASALAAALGIASPTAAQIREMQRRKLSTGGVVYAVDGKVV